MTHSFFAGMGGFVCDTEDPGYPPYIPGSPRLILTAHGIAKLAEHGHLPSLPKTMIADKSKADFVAKLLAIYQASWFLVQCVARWRAHLTMTLLELNTLAHTICALFMYFFWMNKSYDVHEPIRISGEWIRPLCATMWMFSEISTQRYREGENKKQAPPEIERLFFANVSRLRSPHRVRTQSLEANAERGGTAPVGKEEDLTLSPQHAEDIELGLRCQETSVDALSSASKSNGKSDQFPHSFLCLSDNTLVTRYLRETDRIFVHDISLETGFGPKLMNIAHPARFWDTDITAIRLTRWRLASAVLRNNQHIWGQYARPYEKHPEVEPGCPIYEFPAKNLRANFIDPRVSNWPGDDLLGREDKVLRSFLLSFATAAYGGIHAFAWNAYFATASERHWWRFSSAFVAASGVVFSLRLIGTPMLNCFYKVHKNNWLIFGMLLLAIPLVGSVLFLSVTYIVVRPYLVVQALISLRRLPVNAYQTPRFVQFIPHL